MSQYDTDENKLRETRWKRMGIKYATVKRYEELYLEQDGRCSICNAKGDKFKLNLDHDHKTGLIRGLLCWKCNKKLDHFLKDNRLLKAYNYIRKHKHSTKDWIDHS